MDCRTVDERLLNELMAVDKIHRDIEQVHGWPFDTGIIARMVNVTILPLIKSVIAMEIILTTLHV